MSDDRSNVIPFPNARAPKGNGEAVRDEGNVVIAEMMTTLRLTPSRVLSQEADSADGLEDVIVIGVPKGYDGECFYVTSSMPERQAVLWLLENAKRYILETP